MRLLWVISIIIFFSLIFAFLFIFHGSCLQLQNSKLNFCHLRFSISHLFVEWKTNPILELALNAVSYRQVLLKLHWWKYWFSLKKNIRCLSELQVFFSVNLILFLIVRRLTFNFFAFCHNQWTSRLYSALQPLLVKLCFFFLRNSFNLQINPLLFAKLSSNFCLNLLYFLTTTFFQMVLHPNYTFVI